MSKFSQLGLSQALCQPLANHGFVQATEIQQQAIPVILQGRDLLASAQTGSGKTAAFVLPLLDKLVQNKPAKGRPIRVLCLAPTRELAQQIEDNLALFRADLPLKHAAVYGGVPVHHQIRQIGNGVDFLVATPGRLLDLLQQKQLDLSQVQALVLDEADRMLDQGFQEQIQQLLAKLPKRRQNLLFSATYSDQIIAFTQELLDDPITLQAQPLNASADSVKQVIYEVEQSEKSDVISYLLANNKQQCLVFARTRRNVNQVDEYLRSQGLNSAAIHSDKSQHQRLQTLQAFKDKQVQILVATDIAARGLDIEQLPLVINFDIPRHAEDYVHRIGRTGRAGKQGFAISLMGGDERKHIAAIEALIKQPLFIAALPYIDGTHAFEYDAIIDAAGSSIKAQKKQEKARKNQAKKPKATPPKAAEGPAKEDSKAIRPSLGDFSLSAGKKGKAKQRKK